MREICSVEAVLKPTNTEAKLVTSEGSWLFQILAEPCAQFVKFVGVGACDGLPLQSLRSCLKDSHLNIAFLVFAADDEADVFSSFKWVVTFKDEAFVLCLNEGKASRNAGEDGTYAASDNLLESLDE